MTTEIPYFTALLAGMLSFLSPCVLPLVPPYLGYMAGVSLDTLTGSTDVQKAKAVKAAQRRTIAHAFIFVLGFSVVFTSLGAGASTIGQVMRAHLDTLSVIAGIVIIIMGLHFIGLFKINLLYREARFTTTKAGYIGSFLMGVAFAFGWTPCIGPVLGVILALASNSKSIFDGATLLAVYSAGLGIPFILAAFFIGPFMKFLNRFKKHLGTMEKLTGVLLVITGILFLTGGMQTASFWLLETFPSLGNLG